MAHKRFVVSNISVDPAFAELCESGPLAPLTYVLGVVHADDWGRLTADPRRLKLMLFPTLPVKYSEIEEAVQAIADAGLWDLHEKDGLRWIQFPEDPWYRVQSYIGEKRRENCRSEFPNPDGTWPGEGNNEDEGTSNDNHFLRNSKNVLEGLRSSKRIVLTHTRTHSVENDDDGSSNSAPAKEDSEKDKAISEAVRWGFNVTPALTDELERLVDEFGQWTSEAIIIAGETGHPTLAYVKGILRNWKQNGGMTREKQKPAKERKARTNHRLTARLGSEESLRELGEYFERMSRWVEMGSPSEGGGDKAEEAAERPKDPPVVAKEPPKELSVEWFRQLGFTCDEPLLLADDVRYLRNRFGDEAVKKAAKKLAARGERSSVALRSEMEKAAQAG